MKIFAAILAVLCLAAIVGAQTNGDQSDGYSFRDGLWYYPGYTLGYVRTLHTRPGYVSCGVYHAGTSYYQYTQVPAQPVTPTQVVYNADWKAQLLKLDEKLADQAAYQKAYETLNQKYGFVAGHGLLYGNQLFGVNATTQYGYSYNQVVQRGYPDADPNILFQQAFQLAQGAQKFSSEATQGHLAAIGQEGDNRSRVAQINARARAAEAFLRTLDGPPVVQSKTAIFGPADPVQPQIQPNRFGEAAQGEGFNRALLQTAVANDCASCHSGNVRKGGIDMSEFLTKKFTPEMKLRVWERLTTNDPKMLMPQGGPRVGPAALAEYAKAIFGQ